MWVFLDGYKYSPTGGVVNKITVAAGEVWATLTNRKVGVYHFFGSKDTETVIDPEVDTWTETLIDLSEYFTNDPYYICNGINCVYVFEKGTTSSAHQEYLIKSFVEISTITREVVQHKTLPVEAHCYPTFGKFKLWFTTKAETDVSTDDTQSLFYFDTLTGTWSDYEEIPGNKQFMPHKINWAKQSYVYVDGFNENSVYKFNDTTGAFISQIIFNRKPKHLFTNGSRELLVASYSGMISTINQTADTYSNDYATTAETDWFESDGTYIWAVTPEMERVDITGSPLEVIAMDSDDKDYSIDAFSQTSFNQIMIVPPYVHNEWDVVNETVVEVTEGQHIVVASDSAIFIATNLTDSWTLEEIRPYYITVRGTAMIATGPEAYYGETQ